MSYSSSSNYTFLLNSDGYVDLAGEIVIDCCQSLEKILRANYAEDAVFRAERIILHPEYVKGARDQADIALIEVDRELLHPV